MPHSGDKLLLHPAPQRIRFTGPTLPSAKAPLITLGENAPENGYTLSISPNGISIVAANQAAAFYARQTLAQILKQCPQGIPCLEIQDWPDLPVRGYMLDISRCKVPTQDSLYELVDQLAALKYNQLQLYTEHTFAYEKHKTVWVDSSPMTAGEIRALDAYCRERYIELVPNQNSFGHMERWLKHAAYRPLAESPDGFEHPIAGWKDTGSTLKPTPESADFVDSLFAELLPNFTSRQINIGGDEPWELGQGFSREAVAARGKTRFYLDHLLRIQEKVHARGCRMHFWGDIILHEPEMARELSSDTTALIWGYEANHPFEQQCQAMRNADLPYYVVPGTSTWNSIGGRLYTAQPNIEAAAKCAHQKGANGLLLTDWGDNGHHQPHTLSLLPIVQAAGVSWNRNSTECNTSLLEKVSTELVPHPVSLSEYRAILELSSIAGAFSTYLHNASWPHKILFANEKDYPSLAKSLSPKELAESSERLTSMQANGPLEDARQWMLFAARKGIALSKGQLLPAFPREYIESYKHHWLSRNRPGGLEESVEYLTSRNTGR